MAKKSAKPKHVEPEQQSLEAAAPKMSKTDAIRAAVAEGHGSPDDGVAFIKKRFGLELSKGHFSATKSKLKTTEGSGAKRKSARVDGYLAPPEKPRATGERDLLAAMEAMKPLVDSLGVEKVKRLAELLG